MIELFQFKQFHRLLQRNGPLTPRICLPLLTVLAQNTPLLQNGNYHVYGWPPVWQAWSEHLCHIEIINIFTCLLKSEPVKQEVSQITWYSSPLGMKWVLSSIIFVAAQMWVQCFIFCPCFFLKKWANPDLFFCLFLSFQQVTT